MINLVAGVILLVTIYFGKHILARLFTSNEDVIEYSISAFNFMAIFLLIQSV
jgi:multidrug resistance protein, MATE family